MPAINYVADGDSLTANDIAGTTPYTAALSLNGTWTITNKGIDGQLLTTMIANAAANIDPLIVGGQTNILTIMGGTNDIGVHGDSAATVYANIQTYVAARKVAGWNKVLVCTIPSGLASDPIAQAYNALIRAGWQSWATPADGIVDLGLNQAIGSTGAQLTATIDGTHVSAALELAIIVPLFNAALNAAAGVAQSFVPLRVVNTAFGGTSSSASSAASSAFSSTTGNLIVACVRYDTSGGAPVVTVSDQAGHAFTPLTASITAASNALQFWYLKNAPGNAANVITASFTIANQINAIYVWEIQGADTTSPFVVESSALNALTGTTLATAPFTTGNDNEIILSMMTAGATAVTYTEVLNSGLDNGHFPTAGASPFYCGAQHQNVFGIQTNITVAMNFNGAIKRNIVSASFKAATSGVSISGNAGVGNAIISWTGAASGSTVADGSGNYIIPSLGNGSYTITPTSTGRVFNPASSSQTISGTSLIGINFVPTITYVQGAVLSTTGQTSTIACTFNNTAGNLLLLTTRQATTNPVIAVTDSNHNAWQKISTFANGTTSLALFYAPNCKVGANTVTVYRTTAGSGLVVLAEYNGVNTLDQAATAGPTTSNSFSSGNITTTQVSELLVGYGGNETAGSLTFTPGAGWRMEANGSSGGNQFFEDQIVSSIGTYAATNGFSSSVNWAGGIASFYNDSTFPRTNSLFAQSNNGASSTGASLAVAYPSSNIAGNLLVAVCKYGAATSPTILDSQGNSWLTAASFTNTSPIRVFYVLSAKAGANTVTFDGTGASRVERAVILEYNTAALFDQEVHATGSSLFPTSASITTVPGTELLISYIENETANSLTDAPYLGFTHRDGASGNVFVADRVVSPSTLTPIFGYGNTAIVSWGTGVVAFQIVSKSSASGFSLNQGFGSLFQLTNKL